MDSLLKSYSIKPVNTISKASVVCNDATYQNTIISQCQSHLALKHHCMTFAGQGFLVLAKTLNHLNSVHRNTS